MRIDELSVENSVRGVGLGERLAGSFTYGTSDEKSVFSAKPEKHTISVVVSSQNRGEMGALVNDSAKDAKQCKLIIDKESCKRETYSARLPEPVAGAFQ